MDKMEIEIGIGAQSQKVVVIIASCHRSDRYFGGLGFPRCNQLARPAKCFNSFMVKGGRTDTRNRGRLRFHTSDLDTVAIEPVRN